MSDTIPTNQDASTGGDVQPQETVTPQETPQTAPQPVPQQPTYVPPQAPKTPAPETSNPQPQEAFQTFFNEYAETGKLADSSYEALRALGISKEMVNGYIAGHELQAQQYYDNIYNMVGGVDTYAELAEWANNTMTEEQIGVIDDALQSNDLGRIQLTLQGLQSAFNQAMGNTQMGDTPNSSFVGHGNIPTSNQGADKFLTWEDAIAARKDPRYQSDPQYKRQYNEKLNRSNPVHEIELTTR